MLYRTWIPCISGRLSYRLLTSKLVESGSGFVVKGLPDTENKVFGYKDRNLGDAYLPNNLVDIFQSFQTGNEVTTKFTFVLFGSYQPGANSAEMGGNICWFRKVDWDRHLKPLANLLCRNFSERGFDSLKHLVSFLQNESERLSWLSMSFKLERDGVLTLKPSDRTQEYFETLHARGESYLAQHIADEFYCFLRDQTHNHQHHSPGSDRLIYSRAVKLDQPMRHQFVQEQQIHDETASGLSSLQLRDVKIDPVSERKWLHATLATLYRVALELRSSERGAHRAKGILAYADSLKAIAKKRLPESCPLDFNFDSDGILKSIEAKGAEEQAVSVQSENLRSVTLTITIALISIIVSLMGALQSADIPCPPGLKVLKLTEFGLELECSQKLPAAEWLVLLTAKILQHPHLFMIPVAILAFVTVVTPRRIWRSAIWPIVRRFLLRLITPLGFNGALLVLFILIVLSLFMSYTFFKESVIFR
jgi:hypothetical protein